MTNSMTDEQLYAEVEKLKKALIQIVEADELPYTITLTALIAATIDIAIKNLSPEVAWTFLTTAITAHPTLKAVTESVIEQAFSTDRKETN